MRTSTCQTGMGVPGRLRNPSRQLIRMPMRAVLLFQGMAITCISAPIVKAAQGAMTFISHAGIRGSGGMWLLLGKRSIRPMMSLGLPLRVMAKVYSFPQGIVTRMMRTFTSPCARKPRRQLRDCPRCLSLKRPSRCRVISIRVQMIYRLL